MTSKVVAEYRHLATLEICQTRGTHTQSQSQKNGLRRLSALWRLFMYVFKVHICAYKGCPKKEKRIVWNVLEQRNHVVAHVFGSSVRNRLSDCLFHSNIRKIRAEFRTFYRLGRSK